MDDTEKPKPMGQVIQIDEARIRDHLGEMVRGTVEDALNAMLDAEADRLCGAGKYERTEGRKDTRAGSYERSLDTKAGAVKLKRPKLRKQTFETAIIERYQRRESSVEEAPIEMYLAGVSVRRVEDITEALWGTRVSPGTVSKLNKKIYAKIDDWRQRPIEGDHPYVFLRHCQVVCGHRSRYRPGMLIPSSMPRLKGYRFPRTIIAYAVWAYHRFALSTADVEDLLAERGVVVSRETIRLWVNRFGAHFADCIRRARPCPNDKWHMDEVVIAINGVKHWLWRAVDANGDTLDILVQTRRSAKAAKRFLARLIAQLGQPRVVITPSRDIACAMHCRAMDKLRSYIKPIARQAPGVDHRAHKGLNNRIEGSHRPTRRREKIMGRFKSLRQAQRVLAAHDQINVLFKPRRYRLTANSYRHARADAFSLWTDYACEMTA